MATITLQIPNSLDVKDFEVLMIVASKFYEQGKLSLGQAATMAGVSKKTFAELVGHYHVSIFNDSPEKLEKDVFNA